MKSETEVVEVAAARPAAASSWSRLIRWASQDRVFKWVPFVPTQALFLFMLPAFLLLIYLSFVNWRLTRGEWWEAPFSPFENFTLVLSDPRFLSAVGNTVLYAFVAVPVEFLLGLTLALATLHIVRARSLFFAVFLIPMMIVPVVVGYNFTMIFSQEGPFNQVLSWLTGSTSRVNWLADITMSKVAIILADVWQWTPLMFLMLLAGLVAMPNEPIRAAQILGANTWQVFWKIKLPLLKPIIVIALVLRLLEALKLFDTILLVTGGGPGTSSESVAMVIYKTGWEYNRVSRSAAMALAVFVGTMALIFVSLWLVRRERRLLEEASR